MAAKPLSEPFRAIYGPRKFWIRQGIALLARSSPLEQRGTTRSSAPESAYLADPELSDGSDLEPSMQARGERKRRHLGRGEPARGDDLIGIEPVTGCSIWEPKTR